MKEGEKPDRYLDLARERKKLVEHEEVISSYETAPKKLEKRTGWIDD